MSRRLLSWLDRLPAPVRRLVVVAIAVVLLGAVMAALTLAPPPDDAGRRGRAPGHTPPRVPASAAPMLAPAPVSPVDLQWARRAGALFLASYLPFAYGRVPANAVRGVTAALRRELTSERRQLTPVERRRRPRVDSLEVAGMTPGFVVATATIEDGGIAPYRLRLTLQGRRADWLVNGVQSG